MRAASSIIAVLVLAAATGCPNEERNASIEAMNAGIKDAQQNNFVSAIKHLKEAARLYPDNHQAWYTLGEIYKHQAEDKLEGDERKALWEQSVEAYSEAVRIRGKDPMYQMCLGIALYHQGNKSLAATHLEKALELENRLATAHFYLGRVHDDNDEPAKAAQAWTQAAMIDPVEGKPFVNLGKLYLLWDMIPQAISVLSHGSQHVQGNERTNVFYYLGLAHDAKQDWDKAIEAYSQAIDSDPGNLDAKFQRGLAYARKGDKGNARADLQEYAKSSPDSSYKKQEANKVLMTLIAE